MAEQPSVIFDGGWRIYMIQLDYLLPLLPSQSSYRTI